MNQPLSGIRVLDFGRYIAAPYCAMLLADFGADVIRIERREGGEDRALAPITDDGEGAMYICLNRNKRSLTLDPAHPQSAEIKRRLVAGADVVLANLPVNVLKKLGLDYEALTAIKPDIILTRISTFGPDGPYANRVGFDSVIQAMSGAMSLTGFPGPPVRSAVAFEDFGTALHAAFGTMVALFERRNTGRGQIVDASLLASGVAFMMTVLAERYALDLVRRQQGNAGFYSSPADAYQTKDGWIFVQVIGGPMFKRWATLVERTDLIDDPRCADDISRADHYALIGDAMNAWAGRRSTADAIAALEQARIPCGKIYELAEVFDDPQVQARQLFQWIPYPGAKKKFPIPNTPVRLSATPGEVKTPAPSLGQHNEEILHELNFSDDEITNFRRDSVI
jgi:crotonobetainyl-CoA:carnitine CoA-transferase CaiB-like acyl-CoA transferase